MRRFSGNVMPLKAATPRRLGLLHEVGEQDLAEAGALPGVGDDDAEIPIGRRPVVAGAARDADLFLRGAFVAHRDQRDLARRVDVGPALELARLQAAAGQKTQIGRATRQAHHEAALELEIAAMDRPDPNLAAVAQQDFARGVDRRHCSSPRADGASTHRRRGLGRERIFCLRISADKRSFCMARMRPANAKDACRRSRAVARSSRHCEPAKDERHQERREQHLQAERDACVCAGVLVDLDRARGADAVRCGAEREAAHRPRADAQRVEQVLRRERADHAGDDREHRRQRRHAADAFGDPHRDRCGHRLGRERADDIDRHAEPARREHRAAGGGSAADERRDRQGDATAANLGTPHPERPGERDHRGAEQDVNELRAGEISRIAGPRRDQHAADREHRPQHRIRPRRAADALVDELRDDVGDERRRQAEQRRRRQVDPELDELIHRAAPRQIRGAAARAGRARSRPCRSRSRRRRRRAGAGRTARRRRDA